MRTLLALLVLGGVTLAQDNPYIRVWEDAPAPVRRAKTPIQEVDEAEELSRERKLPVFVWVNIDPEKHGDLYDALQGIHVRVPELFGDKTPRLGACDKDYNYLYIREARFTRDTASQLNAEWNGTPPPAPAKTRPQARNGGGLPPPVRAVPPPPPPPVMYAAPPREVAVTRPFPGSSGQLVYNPSHTCPRCSHTSPAGQGTWIVRRDMGGGKHTHDCPRCGQSWWH